MCINRCTMWTMCVFASVPFIILYEQVLTIDRIELQDSAHIQQLRADQLQNGDVPQTYVTVATTYWQHTSERSKSLQWKSDFKQEHRVCNMLTNCSVLLLIQADFTAAVYYWNHPNNWFLGKGRRTRWSGEYCQKAVSSEARKPTLNTGERRLYLVRAKSWIPGSNLSSLQPSQQDRPLFGAGREGTALGANPAKSNTWGEKRPHRPCSGPADKQDKLFSSVTWLTHMEKQCTDIRTDVTLEYHFIINHVLWET